MTDAVYRATAVAHANIALIKYWGKRGGSDPALNLPAVGSLSITLEGLTTKTTVCFDDSLAADQASVNGHSLQGLELERITAALDRIRELAAAGSATAGSAAARAWRRRPAQVISENNFPTAAGLASSASGFAALTKAASSAAGLGLDETKLSELARMGSGSAARSLFGGYVIMPRGCKGDGSDAVARQLFPPAHWPLRVVIAITDQDSKQTPSTAGMQQTMQTSPYYRAWVAGAEHDLARAEAAIRQRDFAGLAEVAEASCLKMHATALAANPGIIYWNPATVACMHAIRELRRQGHEVFFTNDAGPQIKAICTVESEHIVKHTLQQIPGVRQLIGSGLGSGARVVASDG